MIRVLAIILAMLALASTPVRAQELYGPPAPGSAAARNAIAAPAPLLQSDTSSALNATGASPFNPLVVLDAAGNAITRPSSSNGMDEPTRSRGGLSTAINIMVVLTVVSLAPSIMLMTTCFTRIIIVLGLLKQAMGTATIPPPQVTTALALFMTVMVMAPTLDRINKEAIEPYRAGEISNYDELWTRAKQPMRDFMFAQIEATGNWSSLYMVLDRRGVDTADPSRLTRADVDMLSLVPAFMLSELKTAFLMGFRLYMPFLVIDMVISTMLVSMSMMMLPPVLISLPFKLLLFVLVDGWTLVIGSLMAGFAQPIPGDPSVVAWLVPEVLSRSPLFG